MFVTIRSKTDAETYDSTEQGALNRSLIENSIADQSSSGKSWQDPTIGSRPSTSTLGNSSSIALRITHSSVRHFKGGRRIQAHVAPVQEGSQVNTFIARLQSDDTYGNVSSFPYAFRIAKTIEVDLGVNEAGQKADLCGGQLGAQQEDHDESDDESELENGMIVPEEGLEGGSTLFIPSQCEVQDGNKSQTRDNNEFQRGLQTHLETTWVEDCNSSSHVGAGDKLLHLLKKWDVVNAAVVVTVWEGGCSRVSRGPGGALFRVIVDAAKEALEKCFIETVCEKLPEGAGEQSIVDYFRKNAALTANSDVNKGERSGSSSMDFSTLEFLSSIMTAANAGIQDSQLSLDNAPAARQAARKMGHRKPLAMGAAVLAPNDGIGFSPRLREYDNCNQTKHGRASSVSRGHFMYGRTNSSHLALDDARDCENVKRKMCLRIVIRAPDYSNEDIRTLRSLTKPNKKTAVAFAQVAALLGEQETSWLSIRHIFRVSDLRQKMSEITITRTQAERLESWVKHNVGTSKARASFFATSPVAGKTVDWLISVANAGNLVDTNLAGRNAHLQQKSRKVLRSNQHEMI